MATSDPFAELYSPDWRDSIRHLIIDNAKNHVGAHYLNGTDGGTPGHTNGSKGRETTLLNDAELGLRACVRNERRCMGRADRMPNGGKLTKSSPLWEEFQAYRKKNEEAGLPDAQWTAFHGLFPRKTKNGQWVLGEDCSNLRHFDCISFVNYILSITLGENFSYSIVQYEGNRKTNKAQIAPVKVFYTSFPTPKNGDILTRIKWVKKKKKDEDAEDEEDDAVVDDTTPDETDFKWIIAKKHIGFVTADNKVVHASGPMRGVIISDYNPTEWTGFCRLKKSVVNLPEQEHIVPSP